MQQDSNNNIRLFIVGDFCSKPTTSYMTPSEEFKELMKTFDCRVVNFEVPLKPEKEFPPRSRERFFQNDDAPDFLRNLGFDLFSMANNHVFDWGEAKDSIIPKLHWEMLVLEAGHTRKPIE